MRKLLVAALVLVVAFVTSEFIGTLLQHRAQNLRAAEERARSHNSSVATVPGSTTP